MSAAPLDSLASVAADLLAEAAVTYLDQQGLTRKVRRDGFLNSLLTRELDERAGDALTQAMCDARSILSATGNGKMAEGAFRASIGGSGMAAGRVVEAAAQEDA